MKIFELVETAAIVAPSNTIKPMPPGTRPSGDMPVPPTENAPQTSNTPQTPQPTGFTKPTAQADSNTQPTPAQAAPATQQPPQNNQDVKSQLQALMTKIQQLQQIALPDPENPVTP
jgi:hypothetical protein